ncbi:hypothetical protein [Candidatus Methylobacter favarea]|uniref:hypothetical protein n=1 Tax=Candidatus Methylobacter favarea TaxID=2707345 RepID=UPI00157DB2A6|nr:hypothetical protein [Candidatus Methylobacter favarea]
MRQYSWCSPLIAPNAIVITSLETLLCEYYRRQYSLCSVFAASHLSWLVGHRCNTWEHQIINEFQEHGFADNPGFSMPLAVELFHLRHRTD